MKLSVGASCRETWSKKWNLFLVAPLHESPAADLPCRSNSETKGLIFSARRGLDKFFRAVQDLPNSPDPERDGR